LIGFEIPKANFRIIGGIEMKIEETIQAWAKRNGYHTAEGSISLLKKVRASLKKRWEHEEIEDAFFRNYLEGFSYLDGCRLENPQSILIIAVPRPAHILSFSLETQVVETTLPPTYVRYRKIFSEVRDDLEEAVSAFSCRLEILSAPLKALASLMGLISYGRNNIGYIQGLGSYFQLVGIVLDKRIGGKRRIIGSKQSLLSRCRDCRICVETCPTGAISKDRFLLHAEKCYTLFSESSEPIPEGLKPPSPKCLIGCLRCQQVCPENRRLLRYEKAAVSFDLEETLTFLNEAQAANLLRKRARSKLLKLELTEDFPIYARNLKRMFELRRIAVPGK
jgi:epoxyqueuosine reductase